MPITKISKERYFEWDISQQKIADKTKAARTVEKKLIVIRAQKIWYLRLWTSFKTLLKDI